MSVQGEVYAGAATLELTLREALLTQVLLADNLPEMC